MVKFRIGFTIEAETLFAYISKLMPSLHDLHVEEVYDVQHTVKSNIVNKLVSEHKKIEKPISRKPYERFVHSSGKPLTFFIKEYMEKKNGNITWKEAGDYARSLGYSKSSINNAIIRLVQNKIIEKKSVGVYGLIKK
jgi:hypothetical protein